MADYVNTRSVMGDDEAFDAFVAGDLETLIEDGVTDITSSAIRSNMMIKVVDLPNATSIGSDAFNGSTNLKDLILRKTSKCSLYSISAFTGTAIADKNGAVFVPSNLVETYKADSNWKNYNIFPLDEYPTDDYSTIRDTWAQIEAAVTDKTYKTKYAVGDTKLVDLGTEGKILMQIVAFDADELTDGGAAAITWVAAQLINSTHSMNSSSTNANGYPASSLRSWLSTTILPLFPSEVQAAMKEVKKYSRDYTTHADLASNEKLWIPSTREMFGSTEATYEKKGNIYAQFYNTSSKRIKKRNSNPNTWWLRSSHTYNSNFWTVGIGGNISYDTAQAALSVCLGFCTGKSPIVISDSWSEIFVAEEDGSYSEKYSVGMRKTITIGQYIYTAEIAGINVDTLSDDSGTAKITWILRELYPDKHSMNSSSTNVNGYPASSLRSWLSDTVFPLFPSEVQAAMKEVKKTSWDYTTQADLTSNEKLWIPSAREVGLFTSKTDTEKSGPIYSDLFPGMNNTNAYIKRHIDTNYTRGWWLRSAYNYSPSQYFQIIYSNGQYQGSYSDMSANSTNNGVLLGFCT